MKLRLLSPLPFLLGAAGLSAAAPAASPAPVEGYHFVQTVGAISEYTLDANGLQVLLLPDHSAPVITYQVTYRVGSRNEVTGTTGATHLLEHLMFKGSTHFNRELGTKVDQILDPIGATNNASTWVDRTNYHETFGAEHLPLIVRMEADRMRGLLLRDSDRQPEMTVVRNEFERGENSPFQALMKEITAAAYVAHPYHHSTIGWRSDIEQVSTAKLREFYDTYYWPDNATVSVVGDFQPAAALALVRQHYAAIPRAPKPIPQLYTQEPEQTGPRRVVVKRAGRLGVSGSATRSPPPPIPTPRRSPSSASSSPTARTAASTGPSPTRASRPASPAFPSPPTTRRSTSPSSRWRPARSTRRSSSSPPRRSSGSSRTA